MNKIFVCLALLLVNSLNAYAQPGEALSLVAEVNTPDECSDIWGFVDTQGIEYAVIGTTNGIRIYSLAIPSQPEEVEFISEEPTIWRDIKSFGDYIYVGSENAENGTLIIDMSDPSNIKHQNVFLEDEDGELLTRSHNIFIDEYGYLYLAGTNLANGGILIYDLNDNPEDPKFVGEENDAYAHDVFVQNNIMYCSEVYEGQASIYSVTNKSNPSKISSFNTTSNFTHNAWASADGNFLYTTDERSNAYLDAYDISDSDDIRRVNKYRPVEGNSGIIPHNTHVEDNFLITSWYSEGVIVLDATRPDILVKVGQYDTHGGQSTGFNGCWGTYPYLPSGLILASDIGNGLFVLQPNYTHAGFLEGNITDFQTGLSINSAEVILLNPDENTLTDPAGNYKMGSAKNGSRLLQVSKPGYLSQTVKIDLLEGQTIIRNIQLIDSIVGTQDLDQDGFTFLNDCDDNNPLVNSDQPEVPNNNVDEDCDGVALIIDVDMDGYNSSIDCDDNNPAINAGSLEIPNNEIDEDCDGTALVIDMDGDGYNSDEDCDDNNSTINPGQVEVANNFVDEDCDGLALFIDEDMDGYHTDIDCDDTNAGINPSQMEIPNNEIDEDCDGIALIIDEDADGFNSDEDCNDNNPEINSASAEIPNNEIDEDCDGIALIIDEDADGFNSDEDCDDNNPEINPASAEIPNNDIDEDCDGAALVIDEDADGFNSDEDCDDNNADVYPLAEEIPNNGIDEDCDGEDLISSKVKEISLSANIYPIPTEDIIYLELGTDLKLNLDIYTTEGVNLIRTKIKSKGQISLSHLKEGYYFLTLSSEKENISFSKKIIKL